MRYKYNKTRERKAPCGATVIGMSKYHDKLKKLFDTQKEGKGVAKNIDIPKNFIGFFSYFKLHLHDIFRVNLLLIIGNFPIFFFLYAMTGNLNCFRCCTACFCMVRARLHLRRCTAFTAFRARCR